MEFWGKCRYVSERAYNASMIHRNPESLQLIGCQALPLVGMDLLDKRTIFFLCYTEDHALGTVQTPCEIRGGEKKKRPFARASWRASKERCCRSVWTCRRKPLSAQMAAPTASSRRTAPPVHRPGALASASRKYWGSTRSPPRPQGARWSRCRPGRIWSPPDRCWAPQGWV